MRVNSPSSSLATRRLVVITLAIAMIAAWPGQSLSDRPLISRWKGDWILKMAMYYYSATDRMVELLLEQGENARAVDEDGIPILNFACLESSAAVKPLLKHGADPNAKDRRGSTPLMATSNPEMARLLIRHGAEVDARDADGSTALILAPYKADFKLVEALVAAGADVDARSNDDSTVLQRACDKWADESGDLDPSGETQDAMVSFLLSEGADPDVANRYGDTPLMIAARANLSRVAELLLQHSASINERNDAGETALDIAESSGDEDLVLLLQTRSKEQWSPVDELLKTCEGAGDLPALGKILAKAKPDLRTKGGWTPLMQSAAGGCIGCARLLLEKGADINVRTERGMTPLMVAARAGQVDMVKYFLTRGADASAKRRDSKTAAQVARGNSWKDIKAILTGRAVPPDQHEDSLESPSKELTKRFYCGAYPEELRKFLTEGNDVNAGDSDGNSLIMAAVVGCSSESLRLLIDAGADVNAPDNTGITPLHRACLCWDPEIASTLLEAGADPNAKDKNGRTPLALACIFKGKNYGREEGALAPLLRGGADPNVRTKDGRTALLTSAELGSTGVVAALLDAGAAVDARDGEGKTAFLIAAERGQVDLVRLLLDKGADVNAKDMAGRSALTLAAKGGHQAVVDLLEALKPSTSKEPKSQMLRDAVERSDAGIARQLLAQGVNPNLQIKAGETLLVRAVQHDSSEMVAPLPKHGADPNLVAPRQGLTPLMIAASTGKVSMVELLRGMPQS